MGLGTIWCQVPCSSWYQVLLCRAHIDRRGKSSRSAGCGSEARRTPSLMSSGSPFSVVNQPATESLKTSMSGGKSLSTYLPKSTHSRETPEALGAVNALAFASSSEQ
eukprot:561877-Alexandrium_andersonii.AAC.1